MNIPNGNKTLSNWSSSLEKSKVRSFNFDTLSTQVYQLIADEMLEQGALGAILIVLFGLLPIIILNKSKEKV